MMFLASEVKNDHVHVIMHGICNKFIFVCDVWFDGQIVCSNIEHLSNIDEINDKHYAMFLRITFVVYFERLERFKNIKNKSLQSCYQELIS